MPKLTSPRSELISSLPRSIRPNTTQNTKTLCQNQQVPKLTCPQPCAKYENATPKLIRPKPVWSHSSSKSADAILRQIRQDYAKKLASPTSNFIPRNACKLTTSQAYQHSSGPTLHKHENAMPKSTSSKTEVPQPYAKYKNATPKLIRPKAIWSHSSSKSADPIARQIRKHYNKTDKPQVKVYPKFTNNHATQHYAKDENAMPKSIQINKSQNWRMPNPTLDTKMLRRN